MPVNPLEVGLHGAYIACGIVEPLDALSEVYDKRMLYSEVVLDSPDAEQGREREA